MLEMVTAVNDGEVPDPDDPSICFSCSEIIVFNDDLSYRKPTDEDLIRLKSNQEQWNALHKARYFLKEMK